MNWAFVAEFVTGCKYCMTSVYDIIRSVHLRPGWQNTFTFLYILNKWCNKLMKCVYMAYQDRLKPKNDIRICRFTMWSDNSNIPIFYSERPLGAGFRSVNPAERWHENPARALARAGFSQHLECGIHRSESSPEGSFALIPHPVARWAKNTP